MDNALSLIQGWIGESPFKIDIIPRSSREFSCQDILHITEHSVLGTIVNHAGGISISACGTKNLVRHFGGENQYGLSIRNINQLKDGKPQICSDFLLVADDIFGGLFAIDTNGTAAEPGNVVYLPPDSYLWENLETGHADFLHWLFTGNLEQFYQDYLKLGQEISCQFSETRRFSPPLWTNARNFQTSRFLALENILLRVQMLAQL